MITLERLKRSSIMLIGALFLLGTAVTNAQDEDREAADTAANNDRVLEEIIVSAMRTSRSDKAIPNKITFFEAEEIAVQQTLTVNPTDMLANLLPSYSASRQKLTGLGESFRGRSPLFMIDGVPQSNPLRNGNRAGYTIDMAVVEEIEVIFGANAIQGLGATGGIINYITLRPPQSGEAVHRAELGFSADDNFNDDGYGWRANYIFGQRHDAWDVTASATYELRDLFYDGDSNPVGVDETQGDIADSETWNFFFKLGFEPSDNQRIQFMLNNFNLAMQDNYVSVAGNRTLKIPTTSIPGHTPGEPAENDVTTFTANYAHLDLFGGRFSAQLYLQDFSSSFGGGSFAVFQDPLIAPVGTLFDQSENNSEKTGLRFTQAYSGIADSAVSMILGIDFLIDETFQRLIFTGRDWVPNTEFKNHAPFVQLDVDVTERLQLSGGLRRESAKLEVGDFVTLAGNRASSDFARLTVAGGSPDFDETMSNFGAVFQATDDFSVYGSFSEGFSMPDVGRVLRGVSQPGMNVESLLNLAPLVTENIEFGAEYNAARGGVQFAWFESTSDFGIRLVPDADGIFSVNREETEIDGWEISGNFEASELLNFAFGAAFLDGKFDSNDDGSVDADLGAQDIGSDRVNFSVNITPQGDWNYRLQSFTYLDERFRNAAGTTTAKFEGYTVVDFLAAWALNEQTQLTFALSNLFDEQYLTYYSQAGNTRADRYNAGRGRTLSVKANFRF